MNTNNKGPEGAPLRQEQSNQWVQKHSEGLDLFPSAFLIFCSILFMPCLVKMYTVFDANVEFWMGMGPRVGFFIPIILILFGYFLNAGRRTPSKMGVLVSLIGPSIALLVLADVVLMQAADLGNKFKGTDCTTFTEKYELQNSWKAASTFYGSCFAKSGGTKPETYLIGDCPGYSSKLNANPSWSYLAHLESDLHCGGFCEAQQPMWTYASGKVSCSQAVSEVMFTKIQRVATQVVCWSLVVLGIGITALVMLGPYIRSKGIDW